MQGSSLQSWTQRISNQLNDLLSPNPYNEIDPSEALQLSLHAHPSWTLLALAQQAKDAQFTAERTLALVLLRRFVVEWTEEHDTAQIWDIVPVATQKQVQTLLLDCVECAKPETMDEERNSLCKTITFLAEVDGERGHAWPQLETCLRSLSSPAASEVQQDLFFRFVIEAPLVVADVDVAEVVSTLQTALQTPKSAKLLVMTVKAAVAILISDDRAEKMDALVPSIMDIFPRLGTREHRETLEKCLFAFLGIFDSISCEQLLSPYLSQFLPFVMSLLQAKDSNSQVVGAVIEFLASTTEMSSDRSVGETFRAELTLAIKIMLDLMSIGHGPPLNGSWWDHDVGSESVEDQQEVYAIAEQALDRMTRSLGGQYVLPIAFQAIPRMVKSDNWEAQYAGLSAIGTMAEGGAEQYKKDLDGIMQLVTPCLSHSNFRVVYSAIYATAELCTYLQGKVQESYPCDILAAISGVLRSSSAPQRLIGYAAAALVNFAEDASSTSASLRKWSPEILQQLVTLFTFENTRKDVKESCMSATASLTALLGHEQTLSMDIFQGVMQALWSYLHSDDTDNDLRARAIDCATLVAVSLGKQMAADDVKRLLTTLIHLQQVHTDDDDPCVPIVRTGLVRMAELMGEDFLPHTQLVIPQLLRLANTQAEHTLQEGLNADMDDSNQWRTSVTAAGGLVKVNTETVREKEQAIMLLYALANSLGSGLMEVGDDETTTGDWTAYAEAMLETAKVHLEYDHSGDVRQAASLLLPAPVKSIKSSTRYSEEYNLRLIGGTVPSLIAALTYENESEPLAALFRAASDVVLAVPEVFSQSDAECFVKAMRDQIEELQVYTSDLRTRSPPDLVTLQLAQEDAVWTLQSMTTTLACFLSVMGSDFPIQPLFNVFNQAVYGQLGVDGEREWAFRLIADLVKYASPAAMAWTAGFLPLVTDTLTSSNAELRRIAAYTAGLAAQNEDGLYTPFYRNSFPILCQLLTQKPSEEADEQEVYAHDNVISAVAKIMSHDTSEELMRSEEVLPVWVASLPILKDEEEMEPTYSFLLKLMETGHPAVDVADATKCRHILYILNSALGHAGLPVEFSKPLGAALQACLSKAAPEVQREWTASQAHVTQA